MANYVTRKHLSRRTVLGGMAASIALPWLDAMLPAFAAPKAPVRAVFVFAPNGKKMDDWTPKSGALDMTPILAPLKDVKKHLLLISGLAIDGARAHGDGPGDHARSAASFLTCAHPRKTGGADIQVGTSIDQVLAAHVGEATPFPSLELGMEGGRAGGVCDSGYSCAYTNNISWRTPNSPMAKETRPRSVFARLFGDPDGALDALQRQKQKRALASILDSALEDAKQLRRRLGPGDRGKLDEYLDSVRQLETRLERSEAAAEAVDVPAGLAEAGSYPERLRLMYELIALALQTDRTRVVSLMLGNGGSNLSYRFVDAPEGHHDLSHHGNEPEKLAKIQRINTWHMEQFAAVVKRLEATVVEGVPLIDQTAVVYGSAIADGNAHNHEDLPFLVAGRGGGHVKTRRHLRVPRGTPAANLYLSLMRMFGLREAQFADSTAPLF